MAQVEIEIIGKDTFSGTLGNLGNILTGIKSAIDLVAGAFDAAADFVGQFVDSAAESELVVAKLDAVLRATGGAAGLSSEQLQEYADQLQNVTRFSDEQILSATTVLLTFRNIGDEIATRAIPLMLDMAEIFGSEEAAAMQLGKALNDPLAGLGALSRAGVTFTAEQKEQIKVLVESGQLYEAQTLILNELEMQVGGTARAVGETFTGQIAIAMNKLDSFKELIGGPIMAVLGELLGFFMDKWDNLMNSEWPPAIILRNLNDNLEAGMPFLQAFGFAFKDLFELTPEQEALFDSIGGFFLTLQSALDNNQEPLQAFITAFDYLSRSDGPLAGFGQAITNVLLAFDSGGILAAVDTFVAELANALTNEINTWINSDGPEELSDTIISWFDDIGTGTEFDSKAAAAAGNLLAALKKAISEIDWMGITDSMDSALARVIERQDWYEAGKSFGDSLADALINNAGSGMESKGSEAIPTIGRAIGDWIRGAIGDVYFEHSSQDIAAAFVNMFIANVKQNFATSVQWTKDVAANIVNSFITAVKTNFATSVTWAKETIDKYIIQPIKDALGIASPSTVFMQIGQDVVTGLIAGITSMLGFLLTFANTFAGSFVSKVVEKFGDLRDKLSTIFTEIKEAWDDNGIAGVLSYLQDKISGIGDTTTGTVGGMEGDTSHDPRSGGEGSTLTGTTTNTFNFYGTVYMSGVGPEGTFDCPSPHPIMIASSQSLLTSGVA